MHGNLNLTTLLHCGEDIVAVRERIARETSTQQLEQCVVQLAILRTLIAFLDKDIERKLLAHYAMPSVFGGEQSCTL